MNPVLLKKIVPFTVTLLLGSLLGSLASSLSTPKTAKPTNCGFGVGYSSGSGSGISMEMTRDYKPLKIVSKPLPNYTEEARKNNVSGVVRLVVTFSSSGNVTDIKTISGLPYGLTDEALAAARRIEFEPTQVGGSPVSVSKTVEYKFSLY